MAVTSVLMTTTAANSPLDASTGDTNKPTVSEFLTIQSLANFAAMTGAISAAWHALQHLLPAASSLWVPYGLAVIWGLISVGISYHGLKNAGGEVEVPTLAGACFVAFINSLVLAGAVVGTNVAVSTGR